MRSGKVEVAGSFVSRLVGERMARVLTGLRAGGYSTEATVLGESRTEGSVVVLFVVPLKGRRMGTAALPASVAVR